MSWIKLIVLVLQLIKTLIDGARERGLIQQGADEEIARVSAAILLKTQSAKKIMEEINEMDEAQVDALLRSFEPGGLPDNGKP